MCFEGLVRRFLKRFDLDTRFSAVCTTSDCPHARSERDFLV